MTSESSVAAAGQPDSLSPPGQVPIGRFAQSVLRVTAIAGTLDIIAAHVHVWAATGNPPLRVFKSVAGGLLGRTRAMEGAAGTVMLGAFCHYFISFAFTLLFFLLHPRVRLLRLNPFASGFVYALFVWCTMNFLVLPLSALHAPMPNFASKHTYIGIGVLIAVFGIPIAMGADRFYRRRGT